VYAELVEREIIMNVISYCRLARYTNAIAIPVATIIFDYVCVNVLYVVVVHVLSEACKKIRKNLFEFVRKYIQDPTNDQAIILMHVGTMYVHTHWSV
jgi:hypothetical protein